MNEREDFIARMEASGIAPTWETIYALNVDVARLRAKLDDIERQRDDVARQLTHIRAGAARANNRIEQTLGAALGYPRYCDDLETFPEATEADGVCVGDHVAETLAEEAADKITELRGKLTEAERQRDEWKQEFRDVVDAGIETLRRVQAERDRYRAALVEYGTYGRWQIRDHDGALRDYIGDGEGPELALKALGAAAADRTDYRFLCAELAAAQFVERARLNAAIDALSKILNWATPTSAIYRVAREALIAITNDEEGNI